MRRSLGGLATILLSGTLLASPALAALRKCDAATLSAFRIAGVTISSATVVPASGDLPEYCSIKGAVATVGEGASDGSAQFNFSMPSNWNHKLLFLGVAGLDGAAAGPTSEPLNKVCAPPTPTPLPPTPTYLYPPFPLRSP